MDLMAVYKKTLKGQEEIAHRTVLGMRERALLVMVDGKTTAADLLARAQHMPDPPALLAKLIDGGFIAADEAATAVAVGSAPAASGDPRLMQELMRYAEHFLDAVLGPEADMLSEAVDRCKTLPELRARLERTRDALVGMGKKRKAEEFWSHVEARLEGRPAPAGSPAAAPSPPAVEGAPPAPSPAVPAAAPPPPAVSPQETLRFARRYLADSLGPEADPLIQALERCRTVGEFRQVLENTRDTLLQGAGRRRAEEFWAGVVARMPPP